jgi:hypothetical protein
MIISKLPIIDKPVLQARNSRLHPCIN